MVFNHLQKSLKTLSSSRRNSGVWGVTSGERVWHEQAVWTNVWKEPQDSSGCLGTVASAEKGFEWPWDAWARFDEHDFFLDSSLSSRWPWANYVFHHRQGGLPLCLLLFQKQNMPWAPKTYMFIEVFMGTYITWFFRWPSIQTAIFSMGFLEVFSMGFSSHILCLPLQEVRWTFVGLLHFSVRLHRTCSIGEYRPRLGHCRIKAEVFKLIYGFLDFFF